MRAASSTCMLAHSIILASAGTASPASRTIISPTTRSSLFIEICFPSRITLDIAEDISCSASIAFSALLSWKTPRAAFISTTARIITASTGKACSTISSTPEITAATNRIIVIGSANCFKNLTNSDSFLPSASLFLPFFSNLTFASLSERPSKEVFCSFNTSSELFKYSFINFLL